MSTTAPDIESTHAALRGVAQEALDAFDAIANAAQADLRWRGVDMGDLAMINQVTAEETARRMRDANDKRVENSQKLRQEPAIARLVIADEDDNHETIYISAAGTVDGVPVRMCSYMSPKGQLAPLAVGDGRTIRLPSGLHSFDVIEKLTFKPVEAGGWDAQPAVQFREKASPLTIRSLRDVLRQDGFNNAEADAIEAWLNGDDAEDDGNIFEGIKRDTLTAMQLRVAPILDSFQDRIFRLPIDSRIAVLGPPGTGKTTTLVKRLRQKIDFAYLDPETERPLVEDAGGSLPHANSWIMFTPTELLRLYVMQAFGKEGVPVHDERVRTWEDYRRDIARHSLGILRTTGSGLILREDDATLPQETLSDQIGWFEAFNEYQKTDFVAQLATEAQRLQDAADPRAIALGRQVSDAIARSGGTPLQLLGELAGLSARLRDLAASLRDTTRVALREPLVALARHKPTFLSLLTTFVDSLGNERSDEDDDDDVDGDEDDLSGSGQPLRGRRLVEDTFIKAMRSWAIARASGRTPAAGSRAGRLLAWIRAQDLALPDMKDTGGALLTQRAALRLARAPADYLTRVPLRYRRFRRAMRDQGRYYFETRSGAQEVHPAEVDLIILAMLRAASAIEADRLLMQRLGDRLPAMVRQISTLRRNQVLVDEATDFSPVELACMRALAVPGVESLFLSGDYNQRLTRWGSRSDDELLWVSPDIQIKRINVTYRQSRKLADFAMRLGVLQGYQVHSDLPDGVDNDGFEPVLGRSLYSIEDQTLWLVARIREINGITDGMMPTIAVLVTDSEQLEPLASALSEQLRTLSIRAVACPKGLVKGQNGDVRIFEVEHIKGLEFEAVFFMGVDDLQDCRVELLERYIYVGATRAATFLGLSCRGDALPEPLAPLEPAMAMAW